MPTTFQIGVSCQTVAADLSDTECAKAIAAKLPFTAKANTWGEEIYFRIGVKKALDDTAREVVELGDIGYWPTGDAICFFFCATPVSGPGEIRPASAVNIVGRILGDLEILKRVKDGDMVVLKTRESASYPPSAS